MWIFNSFSELVITGHCLHFDSILLCVMCICVARSLMFLKCNVQTLHCNWFLLGFVSIWFLVLLLPFAHFSSSKITQWARQLHVQCVPLYLNVVNYMHMPPNLRFITRNQSTLVTLEWPHAWKSWYWLFLGAFQPQYYIVVVVVVVILISGLIFTKFEHDSGFIARTV